MKKTILKVKGVSKSYTDGNNTTEVLKVVDLSVFEGEQLAIVGSSGSGKSTLLHVMGTLDKPSQGDVFLGDEDVYSASSTRQSEIRNQDLGFIYQFHHLLPEFSAVENVAMPAFIQGVNKKQALGRAEELLNRVGLGHRLTHTPAELSGGERQRVAIARALINKPRVVLADEPTGNLDAASGESVYALLKELSQQIGTAFVVVTHDSELAAKMDRQLIMKAGKLEAMNGETA
ncbi:lipoprotein-releasing ABC transporter ATP-binding protein LolD [Shewanella sp. 202IG2-18]|uniref:lipoprotein-releasing ABC transporter ATP-binding protein LolD n=1 Tax=Parashewanella hymeniacidonis TaxID=2807618 RepID=UPI00195FA950|nr:lipoprotein-releasing ABC transporter ATP-binding protein LolD [Parashewanella hymeniacidonis]MBM7072165.1 lipoprotein-releasing ABC transporter ATP-binding protein LolD [Parashewanella hymeniacidonis]